MTFRSLYLVYAVVMTTVIVFIAFNKGAMYREILREGVRATGKVTGIDRESPGREGRVRARIEWSTKGRASTLVTDWKKGPYSTYSVGSQVDLIIHEGQAHFLDEAKAVGGGWLLWAGWAFIVGAPGLLFRWLGFFKLEPPK